MRHSPGGASRRSAPTTRPPATITRRSYPSGGHEFLDQHAMPAKPAPLANRRQAPLQLPEVAAEHHVLAPAAEPRLEHERELDLPNVLEALSVERVRVGYAGVCEPERGLALVVRCEECGWRVQQPHAPPSKRPDLGQPSFDTSSVGVTSRRTSATSPGPRRRTASKGRRNCDRIPSRRQPSTSGTFVGNGFHATTATIRCSSATNTSVTARTPCDIGANRHSGVRSYRIRKPRAEEPRPCDRDAVPLPPPDMPCSILRLDRRR